MPNPLYNQLAQQQPMTVQQALQQMKANPANILKQAGYNVPMGLNDPQQIIGHLLQTGQLSQGRLAQLRQMARR